MYYSYYFVSFKRIALPLKNTKILYTNSNWGVANIGLGIELGGFIQLVRFADHIHKLRPVPFKFCLPDPGDIQKLGVGGGAVAGHGS